MATSPKKQPGARSDSTQRPSYVVLKDFRGLNTKAHRTAIQPDEFSWIENVQPVGHGNLKVVAQSAAVKDSGGNAVVWGNTVTTLASCNIGLKDYILAFEANGAAEYFNITDGVQGAIKTAGFFSGSGISVAQYKNERVLIGDPAKGLFNWDANNVVTIGSLGQIGLTNPGAGYLSAPAVTIGAPDDTNGVQATAVATISTSAGGIAGIKVTAVGSGYTSVPVITLAAPQVEGGTQATAVATTSANAVVAISVTNPGSGYLTAPAVTITAGSGGTGAAATAVLASGEITALTITEAGTGYSTEPTVTISAAPGGGTNATAVASYVTFKTGTVSVLVLDGGSGYGASGTTTVTLGAAPGGGTNATATALISGDQVTQVIMTNPGAGYIAAPSCTITAPSSGVTARAKAVLNADGIVDVATFSGRTWVAAGRTVDGSAAGSYSDFASVSASSTELTDSTLHGNIQALSAANNFLYVWGDDSINVFSDVRVDSSGETLFTNTNVSASVGSKRAHAIFAFFRAVLFMNDYGVYSLVGSTTSKISDDLDGVFPLIDFTQPVSAGQVLLNNILCAAFSCTYTDPVAGARQVQFVFFEKKWFVTSQGALNYVVSVPVSGAVRLYGTTGTALMRCYADTGAQIDTTIQTALMPMGELNSVRTKQALRYGVEAITVTPATMMLTIDSESASSPANTLSGSSISWINNGGLTIGWTNNSSALINWSGGSGYFLYKGDAQQYGKYIGMTLTSTDPGYVVSTFELEHKLRVEF